MALGRTNICLFGSSGGSGGGSSGSDGTVDLPNNIGSIKVSGYNGTAQIMITYADPEKKLLTGVQVAYKTGSYPISPNDGAVVRIPASEDFAEVTGLENEIKYYFRAYPYRTVDGVDYYQSCEPEKSRVTYALYASEWGLKKIADDLGANSDMVRIPKQSWKELGIGNSDEVFPAFIVDGKEVDALYFGKYEASEKNARAYSTKGELPKVSVNFDAASKLCTDKGAGWHMTTRLEWALVMLWCLKNGYQPLGNNDYGKDITESTYSTPDGLKSGGNALATGSGPVAWSHNNSEDGIWDLNGNVWEWQAGFRLYKGELQIISKNGIFGNDAAVVESSSNSPYWYCINGITGALMKPNGSGTTTNSIKITSKGWATTGSSSTYTGTIYNCPIGSNIGTKAKEILQALGLYKPDTLTADNSDYFRMYYNSSGEQLAYAGGDWSHGAGAGVCAAYCDYSRTYTSTLFGFRPAFVELPTEN